MREHAPCVRPLLGMIRRPLALTAVLFVATPVGAWDPFGHQVIGAIAWEHLEPGARIGVARLLLEAPSDSDLPRLLPPGPRIEDQRAREHFLLAQGWADVVRDEIRPERKERYDRPVWHYVNRFWTSTEAGPKALPERGTLGELVERLSECASRVIDPGVAVSDRAIALAWVLHLTGDVHQPLHSSGRVTDVEPSGDRGGNDYALDDLETPNLHAFWDSILGRVRRRHHGEGYFRWVTREAEELMSRNPREALGEMLAIDSPEVWSKEAAAIAMESAYPPYLARGASPPRRYQDEVFVLAARQAALAGYRQARLLNKLFIES